MLRRILWLIPIFLMAGYAFWGLEWTDYQRGYNQALRDARQAEQEMGWVVGVGRELLDDRLRQSLERRIAGDDIAGDDIAGDGIAGDASGNLPPVATPPAASSGHSQSATWREGYQQALRDFLERQSR